ncbi:acyl carrier protein [Paenibacillus endophyticus]|uniref:Acyl carrier protein n=1 Tax=Paenibacillus endophyticus TaxID=1294268 RepID=A0A7W5CD41_9BACL|nr:acyl carrier protein [Paenibacillus endophyticus]MBB3154919.1 acyl carrier protein [Paenibacillus endophyticus]
MLRTEVKQKLEQLLIYRLESETVRKLQPLEESIRLNEDLYLDSVMILQMIVFIEEDMRLFVPEDEVDPSIFGTVGSLLDFIIKLEPLDLNVAGDLGR